MSNATEIIGRLYEAIEAVKMARLKIDGAQCLFIANESREDYRVTKMDESKLDLLAVMRDLHELAKEFVQ